MSRIRNVFEIDRLIKTFPHVPITLFDKIKNLSLEQTVLGLLGTVNEMSSKRQNSEYMQLLDYSVVKNYYVNKRLSQKELSEVLHQITMSYSHNIDLCKQNKSGEVYNYVIDFTNEMRNEYKHFITIMNTLKTSDLNN